MLSKRKLKNSAKNLFTTLQVEIDPLVNKLEYTNNLPNVLEPSKLLLPTDFSESCLLQLSGSRNSAQLRPPLNSSFQCFPIAPKSHLTLRLCVVSFWVKNLSRIQRRRGRSRGKPQGNVQMIVAITISNSQVYLLGFSL